MKEFISFIEFVNMSDEEKYKLLKEKDKEIDLEIRKDIFLNTFDTSLDFRYRELIKLLKEIADFRENKNITYNDKVIILVPVNHISKYLFIDLIGSDEE